MKKEKNIYQKTIIALSIIGLLFICMGFMQSKPVIMDSDLEETMRVVPAEVEQIDEHTVKYRFSFQMAPDDRLCLHFISDEKNIKVYINDKLIYSVEGGDSPVGRVPGRIFHFVKLPPVDCMIDVVSCYKYDQTDGPTPSFWLGDRQLMFKERVKQTLPFAIIYFLTFIGGVILFGCWIIFRKYVKNDRVGFYFSFLMMTMGVWLIRGSEFVSLLIPDDAALTYMGYIIFMQIPFQLFCFSLYYWEMECKVWWKNLFCIVATVNMGVCIFLNMANILEFKYSKFSAHILLLAAFGNMFKGMFDSMKIDGWNYKVKATLLPMTLLCISTLLDMSGYYNHVLESYKRGGILILYAIISISCGVVNDLGQQIKEAQQSFRLTEETQKGF